MRRSQNSAQQTQFNEKKCMTRIILSIISIVLCTAALSASTYAWYLLSITSGTNTVATADYAITVKCDSFDDQTSKMSTNTHATFSELTASAHTLTLTTSSSLPGFAVLEFTSGTETHKYYVTVSATEATTVPFSLYQQADLRIYAHWGDPANFNSSDIGSAFSGGSISFH